mgnify:CR=1 FL=1
MTDLQDEIFSEITEKVVEEWSKESEPEDDHVSKKASTSKATDSPPIDTAPASASGDEDEPKESKEENPKATKGKTSKAAKGFDREAVWYPKSDFFEERQGKKGINFKPEPFPNESNFKLLAAQVKAQYLRVMAEDLTKIANKHCPSKMWPNNILKVAYQNAADAKFVMEALQVEHREHLAKVLADAKARKEKRALEKKDAVDGIEDFKAVLHRIFHETYMAKLAAFNTENGGGALTPEQSFISFSAAKEAITVEFKAWASRINSWSEANIEEAITAANGATLERASAKKILDDAPALVTAPAPASTEEVVLETPKKKLKTSPSDGGPSSSLPSPTGAPPNQKEIYRIRKVQRLATSNGDVKMTDEKADEMTDEKAEEKAV